MAGSYGHVIADDGNLDSPEVVNDMLENGGDVYEAVEQMYGMIWFLAGHREDPRMAVEQARQHYKSGLEAAKRINRGES